MNVLKAAVGFESVTVQARGALDAQGKPSYTTPGTAILARVVRRTDMVDQADGTKIESVATLWIDSAQAPLPAEQDHLLLDAGVTLVTVIERQENRNLQGGLDHLRIRVRLGG